MSTLPPPAQSAPSPSALEPAPEPTEPSAPEPAAPASPWIGRIIDGRYRVVELLAEGGMGTVFIAEHLKLRKMVALKTVHASFLGNEAVAVEEKSFDLSINRYKEAKHEEVQYEPPSRSSPGCARSRPRSPRTWTSSRTCCDY